MAALARAWRFLSFANQALGGELSVGVSLALDGFEAILLTLLPRVEPMKQSEVTASVRHLDERVVR